MSKSDKELAEVIQMIQNLKAVHARREAELLRQLSGAQVRIGEYFNLVTEAIGHLTAEQEDLPPGAQKALEVLLDL